MSNVESGTRVGMVVARFNSSVTESLLEAALAEVARFGIDPGDVIVERVPGAYEIPVALQAMAYSGQFDALVALGCVIRGETPHFDYVCAECTAGVTRVALDSAMPIGLGVLTCDTMDQAVARAGTSGNNKGAEATEAALETLNVVNKYPVEDQ